MDLDFFSCVGCVTLQTSVQLYPTDTLSPWKVIPLGLRMDSGLGCVNLTFGLWLVGKSKIHAAAGNGSPASRLIP
jgi:hypothetical protein